MRLHRGHLLAICAALMSSISCATTSMGTTTLQRSTIRVGVSSDSPAKTPTICYPNPTPSRPSAASTASKVSSTTTSPTKPTQPPTPTSSKRRLGGYFSDSRPMPPSSRPRYRGQETPAVIGWHRYIGGR